MNPRYCQIHRGEGSPFPHYHHFFSIFMNLFSFTMPNSKIRISNDVATPAGVAQNAISLGDSYLGKNS